MRVRTSTATTLVAFAALLAVAACGGSDSGDASSSAATEPAAPEAPQITEAEPTEAPAPEAVSEPAEEMQHSDEQAMDAGPDANGDSEPIAEDPTPAPEEPSDPPQEPAEPLVLEVVIQDGEPVGGVARIEAKKGDTVVFAVRSDIPEEVHVHGFDVTKSISPGQATRFKFEAGFEGIFEVEAHEAGHVVIAKVVVRP